MGDVTGRAVAAVCTATRSTLATSRWCPAASSPPAASAACAANPEKRVARLTQDRTRFTEPVPARAAASLDTAGASPDWRLRLMGSYAWCARTYCTAAWVMSSLKGFRSHLTHMREAAGADEGRAGEKQAEAMHSGQRRDVQLR